MEFSFTLKQHSGTKAYWRSAHILNFNCNKQGLIQNISIMSKIEFVSFFNHNDYMSCLKLFICGLNMTNKQQIFLTFRPEHGISSVSGVTITISMSGKVLCKVVNVQKKNKRQATLLTSVKGM